MLFVHGLSDIYLGRDICSDSINTSPLRSYGALDGSSKLGQRWGELVVRVMSARDHDFGNAFANSFYRQEVQILLPSLYL